MKSMAIHKSLFYSKWVKNDIQIHYDYRDIFTYLADTIVESFCKNNKLKYFVLMTDILRAQSVNASILSLYMYYYSTTHHIYHLQS